MAKRMITYYGGKQRLASVISKEVMKIPHVAYAEPYAGGLAVLFAKPVLTGKGMHVYREAINDNSDWLINMYRVAREQPEEFTRLAEMTPYSFREYRTAREMLRNPDGHTPMQMAWAYYVCISMSFNSKLGNGWKRSVSMAHHPSDWNKRVAILPEVLDRLKNVYIDSIDAVAFMKKWDSPHTVFYLDPPYPGYHQGHYGGFTVEDWEKLCDFLDNATCSYVLSNYVQEREPQADRRIEIKVTSSSRKTEGEPGAMVGRVNAARTEILWIRDRSKNISHPDVLKTTKLYWPETSNSHPEQSRLIRA